jgi:hypothetical protein
MTVLIRDITAVHAAPPNAIAKYNGASDLNVAVKHNAPAKIVVPMASMASAEKNDRAR